MLRPWLVALALVGCGLISLIVYAWSVDFSAPDVVSGLGEAAASVRLEGLGMSLRHAAADMRREEVRRLRAEGASEPRRVQARFALADELRDTALLAEVEGDLDLATECLTEAVQAAPERVDLLCLLTDLRTRDAKPEERRVEFLRLVYEHDAPCAHLMAGESFLEAGDAEAARAYLQRAAEGQPQWAAPRLAMARLELRSGESAAAQQHAAEALRRAPDLRTRLNAAALLRQAGGVAPARWLVIARWLWGSYACAVPMAGVFVVLLAGPALVRLVKRAVAWVQAQRGMAESAS